MSNKKQTAVEWFHKETWKLKIQKERKEISLGEYAVDYFDLFEQAKAMEKEQMIQLHNNCTNGTTAEQYYKETYEK